VTLALGEREREGGEGMGKQNKRACIRGFIASNLKVLESELLYKINQQDMIELSGLVIHEASLL
jgi:hypothetical protein